MWISKLNNSVCGRSLSLSIYIYSDYITLYILSLYITAAKYNNKECSFTADDNFSNDANYLRWFRRGWSRSSDCTAGRDLAVIYIKKKEKSLVRVRG